MQTQKDATGEPETYFKIFNLDNDGWVKSIVIMTERNCGFVLKLLLEMVRTGQSNV